MLPSVIDNQEHRLADVLNELLARCVGGPVDVATAYFAISGYRLVRGKQKGEAKGDGSRFGDTGAPRRY